MIDSLLNAKLPPHLKRSINLAHLENGTYEQIVTHLERELDLGGWETHGELSIPTMTTTTKTLNKQTQPQKAEQLQDFCRYCKKPGHVIRDSTLGKNRNDKVKNNVPKDRMQKHTHLVNIAKELTTHQTCAGTAQTRLIDLRDTKLKNLISQQTTVINQGPFNPAPLRHLLDANHDDAIQCVHAFLRLSKTEKTNETHWFPTLQERGDEAQQTLIQKTHTPGTDSFTDG